MTRPPPLAQPAKPASDPASLIRAENATYGPPPDAAREGVATNRKKALKHARAIFRRMQKLQREGFTTMSALATELNRRGVTGSRGGRITRQRLDEIRERLGKPVQKRNVPSRKLPRGS